MAIINKTGITNGGTIQAEHITRVIDALSGVSTDTLILSGSMTGSIIGSLSGTASFATSASRAITAANATSASYSVTASYAANASSFPYVGTARVTGSLIVSGSTNEVTLRGTTTTLIGTSTISISGSNTEILGDAGSTNLQASKNSILNWQKAGGSGFNGQFVLPNAAPDNPVVGTVYFDFHSPGTLFVWNGSDWSTFTAS